MKMAMNPFWFATVASLTFQGCRTRPIETNLQSIHQARFNNPSRAVILEWRRNFSIWTAKTSDGIGVVIGTHQARPDRGYLMATIKDPKVFDRIRERLTRERALLDAAIAAKAAEEEEANAAMIKLRYRSPSLDIGPNMKDEYDALYKKSTSTQKTIQALKAQRKAADPADVAKFEALYSGSSDHFIEHVEDDGTDATMQQNERFTFVNRMIRIMMSEEQPTLESLYESSDVPAVDRAFRMADYRNPRLAMRLGNSDDLVLDIVGMTVKQNQWRESIRVAVYGGILKDGKIFPIKMSQDLSHLKILDFGVEPKTTITTPYLVLLKYIQGYPSDREMYYYKKENEKGALRNAYSPAAGWDNSLFSRIEWERSDLTIESSEPLKSGSAEIAYKLRSSWDSVSRIYVVDTSKTVGSFTPNELTAMSGMKNLTFRLRDTDAYQADDVKTLTKSFAEFAAPKIISLDGIAPNLN